MSFASEIKDSLCRVQEDSPCCRTAELAAIVCFAGSYTHEQLKIRTEHESVAQRVVTLLSDILSESDFSYEKPKRESGWHIVTVRGGDAAENLADALSLYQSGVLVLCRRRRRIRRPAAKRRFCAGRIWAAARCPTRKRTITSNL